jgi:hypothetical protein
MEIKDKLTIIKCINVVSTPAITKGERNALEKQRGIQEQWFANNLSLIEARKGLRMKNRTMIKNLQNMTNPNKIVVNLILNNMQNLFETEKAKLYCDELKYIMINNKNVDNINTPNLHLLLKTEKIYSWISNTILALILILIYIYFIK